MNALPLWIQVLQALLTPAIAVAVSVIAFMQWRTAHQKVVLDLFDRRLAVYEETRLFYHQIVRHGIRLPMADAANFHSVRNKAAFLFGDELRAFLEEFHLAAINMATNAAQINDAVGNDRSGYVSYAHQHIREVVGLGQQIESMFSPYMRMDQKRVLTVREWLEERNRIRLSRADEKQR